MNLNGTWHVVSSPDFDDDYLWMEGQPYVKLEQKNDRFTGSYHIGLQQGDIDGRIKKDSTVVFSFEGCDEVEPVDGAGTITIEGDRLMFTLMYHEGDDYTFVCERQQ